MAVHQNNAAGDPLDRQSMGAIEFVTWAEHHGHDARLHQAAIGQIKDHPDRKDGASALAQQAAWARRSSHERRLRDSAMAQLQGGG